MKLELRVFRDGQAAPLHTEEVETENPIRQANDLAFTYHLGQPVYEFDLGFRYSEGYVYVYLLEEPAP